MGLIKRPSELEIKSTLTAMIYGQPGIGKSTLACSAPSPVLLDFDGGVERVNGAHQVDTVQIRDWNEVYPAIEEIKEAGIYKTIIIDTVGKMLSFIEQNITAKNQNLLKKVGGLTMQGYAERKNDFVQFIKDTSIMGMSVIFVAHEREDKRGDEMVIRPDISGTASNDLVKELDLVGYMEAVGKERTISFDPCEKYYGKNTCNLYGVIKIPVLIDKDGNAVGENNFFCRVVDSYEQRQRSNQQTTWEYEQLMEVIKGNIDDVKNAEDANNFIEWIKGVKHIYNSKAVASRMLCHKATEIGIKYDKLNKVYEQV